MLSRIKVVEVQGGVDALLGYDLAMATVAVPWKLVGPWSSTLGNLRDGAAEYLRCFAACK